MVDVTRRQRRTRLAVVIGLALVAVGVVAFTLWSLLGSDDTSTAKPVGTTPSGGPRIPADAGIEVGSVAPDFDLPGLNGGRVSLSQFRGKPVVLNFWASWCAPCRAEFPELQRAQNSKDAVVVGVSYLDRIKDDLRDFARRQRATWPLAFDEDNAVGRAYRVPSDPTTFFIDAAGVIRARQFGELSRSDLAAGIRKITPPT